MPILQLILTIAAVGFILWLVNSYIPMQGTIRGILNAVVVIALVLWLLYSFGILDRGGDIHLPRVK